jgi:hypothetical protein
MGPYKELPMTWGEPFVLSKHCPLLCKRSCRGRLLVQLAFYQQAVPIFDVCIEMSPTTKETFLKLFAVNPNE